MLLETCTALFAGRKGTSGRGDYLGLRGLRRISKQTRRIGVRVWVVPARATGWLRVPPQRNTMAAMTCTTVYVGNLNFKTTSEDLVNFFEGAEIGNVVNVDLKKHAADGQSKGWALVDFASAEDASNCADQLNGALLDDRLLTIRLDRKSLPMNGSNFGGMGHNSGGGRAQQQRWSRICAE